MGPGFDTLALALGLYIEVEVEPAASLSITSHGEGAELATDAGHLAARVVREVLGHNNVAIDVWAEIPVGRGLGSSAALAAATAAAAGAQDPLAVAAAVDGHPENAAASVLGGLVTATMVNDQPVACRLPLDENLAFVVLIPTQELPTKRARQALPAQVPHVDAAFNLGRLGLLIAGMADQRLLVHEATDDRLHEEARSPLFPEAASLLRGLVDAGALASCWSGAGPSLLAICSIERADAVRSASDALMADAGVAGVARILPSDTSGLTILG